jgi:hypothetical protein
LRFLNPVFAEDALSGLDYRPDLISGLCLGNRHKPHGAAFPARFGFGGSDCRAHFLEVFPCVHAVLHMLAFNTVRRC